METMTMDGIRTATGAPLTVVSVHTTSIQVSGIAVTDTIAAVRREESCDRLGARALRRDDGLDHVRAESRAQEQAFAERVARARAQQTEVAAALRAVEVGTLLERVYDHVRAAFATIKQGLIDLGCCWDTTRCFDGRCHGCWCLHEVTGGEDARSTHLYAVEERFFRQALADARLLPEAIVHASRVELERDLFADATRPSDPDLFLDLYGDDVEVEVNASKEYVALGDELRENAASRLAKLKRRSWMPANSEHRSL